MTEIKRRWIIAALVVALIAAGIYAISYLPCHVLINPEAVEDMSIIIYAGADGRGEGLEDFDKQAVLEFLTTLQKQRVNRNVWQSGNPAVRIVFFGSEHDSVYLCGSGGDCVCGSYGNMYVIRDPDRAFAGICEILNIDA